VVVVFHKKFQRMAVMSPDGRSFGISVFSYKAVD
jgi:hypothetical protein